METVLVICDDQNYSSEILTRLSFEGMNSLGPVSTAGMALALAAQTKPTLAIVAGTPTGRRGGAELASKLLSDWGVHSWLIDAHGGEASEAAMGDWAPPPEQLDRLRRAFA
ncbi:MAG: hypothetical protein V4820_02420 [Pseudomonadota bacterium]|uniref:hypothetical protein n=1 Tax=Phenylobacterium sp. TaxID=1871053 RepID=UPI00271D1A4D|nr:hypothetical protein [Phenylobacterium sp.]MDO9433646.1 hypothetical protein [Phenylobacterium sp.]